MTFPEKLFSNSSHSSGHPQKISHLTLISDKPDEPTDSLAAQSTSYLGSSTTQVAQNLMEVALISLCVLGLVAFVTIVGKTISRIVGGEHSSR